MTAQQIRQLFLDFFEAHGHAAVPSSSLVPQDDPSVLLTTAGMQQFKRYFSEPALAETALGKRRAASVQKSFRTTDIDAVGDTSHLTFFEMLGNFSFGDYFKEEAISWAWQFMSEVLKIPKSRMHVTIFKGDPAVPRDEASYAVWQKLGLPDTVIKEAGRQDNFWGPTGSEGPCGPTTEIYVDEVEVWNLVFNEYYAQADGRLEKLKFAGVDTGMGLERLALALAKVPTVFETDLFAPILEAVDRERQKNERSETIDRARRILADHFRASCFLIADGVLPSNVKQGYILRRLLRRLIRYESVLGLKTSFVRPLTQSVVENFGPVYPELAQAAANIIKVIEAERAVFEKALRRGLKMFEQMLKANGGQLSGAGAFRLYESYGFPYELTAELARERALAVSKEEFDAAFQAHQVKSRVPRASRENNSVVQ